MDSLIEELFPGIVLIEDDDLREKVFESWRIAIEECPFDSPADAPWAPHYANVAGEQDLIRHINDVVTVSISLFDSLVDIRDFDANRDHVIAGALLHDISKVFEYDETSQTPIRKYLVHPHFSVYVLHKAGIPEEIQHIAISHTSRSGVEPSTIEARVVSLADGLAAEAIFWEATGDLKPYE